MNKTLPTLKDIIADCGGITVVAKRLKRSNQSVHEWVQNGHLPLSDLKGRTKYSETLSAMQNELSLTAADIRRLGLRV